MTGRRACTLLIQSFSAILETALASAASSVDEAILFDDAAAPTIISKFSNYELPAGRKSKQTCASFALCAEEKFDTARN